MMSKIIDDFRDILLLPAPIEIAHGVVQTRCPLVHEGCSPRCPVHIAAHRSDVPPSTSAYGYTDPMPRQDVGESSLQPTK